MIASHLSSRVRLLALLLAASSLTVSHAQAQGWFVPQPAATPATPAAAPAHARPARAAAPEPEAMPPQDDSNGQEDNQPLPPLPLPTIPTVADLPKGKPPPVAIIGVLGVADVMRASNAAQIVQRVVAARREKLREQAATAQGHWRELYQALQADAPKIPQDEGRRREREIREGMIKDRTKLQAENRVIEEAGVIAGGQIERTLKQIVVKVAQSHGMNIVLQRNEVALNTQEFDITQEVADTLNKILPTVKIPDDGVNPETLPKDWGSTTTGK